MKGGVYRMLTMIQSYLFTIKTESVYPKARPFWGNFGIFTGQL